MSEKIRLVQGDSSPQLRFTLTDELTGNPINLVGATVTLHFRAVGASTPNFSRQAIINNQTAANGVCILDWQPGDLNVPAGDYDGEVEVVLSTGARETIYDLLKFKVREDFA